MTSGVGIRQLILFCALPGSDSGCCHAKRAVPLASWFWRQLLFLSFKVSLCGGGAGLVKGERMNSSTLHELTLCIQKKNCRPHVRIEYVGIMFRICVMGFCALELRLSPIGLISSCSILKQCKDVELSFSDMTGKLEAFKGTKKGMLYLTPYRVSLMPAGLPLSPGVS